MTAPTDTWIQHIAQEMPAHGWAVAGLIVAACLAIAICICLYGAWRDVRDGEADLQRELERSERRARGE